MHPEDKERLEKLKQKIKIIGHNFSYMYEATLPEPLPVEQDRNGTYYGYKFLMRYHKFDTFRSPNRDFTWVFGQPVESDVEPSRFNNNGIYACKTISILRDEWEMVYSLRYSNLVIVRVALFGNTVLETEKGFRAHKAQIVEVIHEYW